MKKIVIVFLFITGVLPICSQEADHTLQKLLHNFEYQKALEYIQTQEKTYDLLFQEAMCHKALGEYQKAISILEQLKSEDSDNKQLLFELANCYKAIANRAKSIEYYDELTQIDSTNVYFKIQKAELQFQQGEYEKAVELFYTIYDKTQSSNTLKQIAQCYEMMNEVDSAMAYYRKAIIENPLDAYSTASLTNICLKEGLLPEGKACSGKYMSMDTTNLQVNLLNALCYYATEQEYGEAIDLFRKCELTGDTSLILNRSLGTSYYLTLNYYNAELYLDKAFRQDTTNNTVVYALASSAMELGDYKKSIPLFIKLQNRMKPDSTLLYLCSKNLAISFQKGSQYKESAEAYIKSLDYARSDDKMGIYYTVANIYDDKLDDPKKALTYYQYYRSTLSNYIATLEKRAESEDDKEQIKDSQQRLKALDEHIVELKKGKTENRKSLSKKQSANRKILIEEYIKSNPDTIKKDSLSNYIIKMNQ